MRGKGSNNYQEKAFNNQQYSRVERQKRKKEELSERRKAILEGLKLSTDFLNFARVLWDVLKEI